MFCSADRFDGCAGRMDRFVSLLPFTVLKIVVRKSDYELHVDKQFLRSHTMLCVSGAQILGARSPWRLHFVRWRQIFLGPQYEYGTCFMSPFWCLELWGGGFVFRKFVHLKCMKLIVSRQWLLKPVINGFRCGSRDCQNDDDKASVTG